MTNNTIRYNPGLFDASKQWGSYIGTRKTYFRLTLPMSELHDTEIVLPLVMCLLIWSSDE